MHVFICEPEADLGLHPLFGGHGYCCCEHGVQMPQGLIALRSGTLWEPLPGLLVSCLGGSLDPSLLERALLARTGPGMQCLLSALVHVVDYYGPAMLGLKTDQEVLGELVKTKLPAVAALMDGHGVLWTLVVSRWFICLFVDILPVEVSVVGASPGPGPLGPPPCDASSVSLQTVFRIWDCLFNEGSKIIFRVALTLIKQHQGFILEATSVVDICERFKEITRGSLVTDCHTFMQVSIWVGSVAPPHSPAQS